MDYQELRFKCGIEIHQQLDTSSKLFCECSTEMNNRSVEAKIKRYLRPVASEMGEVDRAVQFEFLKEKKFIYNIFPEVSCLVEMDEEPPHKVEGKTLDLALQIAMMVDCNIPDEIHWMRKTVIDGSNTAGFQRTAIIGLNGNLDTTEGRVGITDIELEEEAAGIHGRSSEKAVYDLNRLGIPLVEIGTDSSIKSPKHAKEVALKLGMLLRSTKRVKRGIGTIRQDVNVSIKEGARVEIKGFQEVKKINKLIKKEVERQKNLVEIKKELEKRDIEVSSPQEVTSLLKESENKLVNEILREENKFYALKASNLSGYMNKKLCENKTLGRELADYAQAHGVGGILHSDEAENKKLSDEFKEIGKELEKEKDDLVVLIAGKKDKVKEAIKTVKGRIELLPEKIPEETRDTNSDFTTSYSRPLPGKARMYPETDVPPSPIREYRLKGLKEELPETLEEKKESLKEKIGEELADQIVGSEYLNLFEKFSKKSDLKDKTIANVFVNIIPDLETRDNLNFSMLSEAHFTDLFRSLNKGKISKDSIDEILKFLSRNPSSDVSKAVKELGMEKMKKEELREKVKKVIKNKEEMVKEEGKHSKKALMGILMKDLKGKASGSELNEILEEEIERISKK